MTKKAQPKASQKVSKEEKYILYALGKSYQSFNKRYVNNLLKISISKTIFIEILISSKSVNKKERALYKNIESLEKKKYVKYDGKELSFTKKGLKEFEKTNKDMQSYIELINHLEDPRTISLHKKIQTKLRKGDN